MMIFGLNLCEIVNAVNYNIRGKECYNRRKFFRRNIDNDSRNR